MYNRGMETMKEKVTINLMKVARNKQGVPYTNAQGGIIRGFTKCIIVSMDLEDVKGIVSNMDNPEVVKSYVQEYLDEYGCDDAEVWPSTRLTNTERCVCIKTFATSYHRKEK